MNRSTKRAKPLPTALTIAGSDSGGCAGIQADLKTFAALGVHGTSAISCLTAQNPDGVRAIQPATSALVRQQMEAVFEGFKPAAAKTGMLYSAPIVREVVSFFKASKSVALVVDPVMVATSGARLLKPSAVRALRDQLLPLAALVTPNLDEAAILVGREIKSVEDLRAAARLIHSRFGCAVLVKGGHLRGLKEAVDIFFDGKNELLLSAPFIKGKSTHGTGCTCSAAITAFLARNVKLPEAVAGAKEFISNSIASSLHTRRHSVLNPFWNRQSN